MAVRRWCPSEWTDEVCQVNVANPADALWRRPDGRWSIVPDDLDKDDFEAGNSLEAELIDVQPGQVVAWRYFETRGTVEVTRPGEGAGYNVVGDVPADVTHWWVPHDPDTISESLDELVANCLDRPGNWDVEGYFVSGDVPLRFEVHDGEGKFVRIEA